MNDPLQKNDQLQRFIFENLDLRGELVVLEDSWQAILQNAEYPVEVQTMLGQALTSVALLSATIKYEGSLILQVQGSGPLSTLVAQATNKGDLRGLARWKGEVPDNGLQDIFGKGQMVITVSTPGKEPHQSIVGLFGEQLADSLEHYFLNSEQLATRFWFFVNEHKAGALLLQQLPNSRSTEEDWERVCILADTTTEEEMLNLPGEALLHRLFHEEQVRLFEPTALRFKCGCSTEKIESTLFTLGKHNLDEALAEEGQITIDCDFCNKQYIYTQKEIETLFTIEQESDSLH